MGFRARHHVNYNGRLYNPGETIVFGDEGAAAIEQLQDAAAIEEFEDKPAKPEPEGLAAHSVAELKAIAEAEGVVVDDKAKKVDLIAAIEFARAAKADSGGETE